MLPVALTQRIGKPSSNGFRILSEDHSISTTVSDVYEPPLETPPLVELSLIKFFRWFQPPVLPTARVVVWGANRSGKSSIIYRWKLGEFIMNVSTIGLLEESMDYTRTRTRDKIRIRLYEIGRDPVSVEAKAIPIQDDDEDDHSSDEDSESADWTDKRQRRSRQARRRYGRCCASLSRCCRCLFCVKRHRKSQALDFAVRLWSNVVKQAQAVVYVVDSSCKISLLEMFDDLNLVLHNDHLRSQNARFLILANKQDVWGAVTPTEIERMLNLSPQLGQVKVLGCSALTGEGLEAALHWLVDELPLTTTNLQMMTV